MSVSSVSDPSLGPLGEIGAPVNRIEKSMDEVVSVNGFRKVCWHCKFGWFKKKKFGLVQCRGVHDDREKGVRVRRNGHKGLEYDVHVPTSEDLGPPPVTKKGRKPKDY